MKTAIVTGITGQDGAYLADFLLSENYIVWGTYRRSSSVNFWRINELAIRHHKNLRLVEFDITDFASTISLVEKSRPDEIYNLAAQSFVGTSFEQPVATANINSIGVLNLLEAIRIINPAIRFYQASTSEMFGKVVESPQNESTAFYPRSPYGVSKLFSHWMTVNYRESYQIFASSGILFNHESPLRGLEFVTRKISDAVAKIYLGSQDYVELGNLDAKRDWGFARDYVKGMWMMLQASVPEDYVLATGRAASVAEFTQMAFRHVGIDLEFHGRGEKAVGIDVASGKVLVRVNPKFYRPTEVDALIGCAGNAKSKLSWSPKTTLEELCAMMVDADVNRSETARHQSFSARSSVLF